MRFTAWLIVEKNGGDGGMWKLSTSSNPGPPGCEWRASENGQRWAWSITNEVYFFRWWHKQYKEEQRQKIKQDKT
jgi:hypothetical protein